MTEEEATQEKLRAYLSDAIARLARAKVVRDGMNPTEIVTALVAQFGRDVWKDGTFAAKEVARQSGIAGLRMAQFVTRGRAGKAGKVVDALADLGVDLLAGLGKNK